MSLSYSLHSDWLVVASKVLDTEIVTRLIRLFALIMANVSLATSGTPKSSLTSFADERREEAILYMLEADGTRDRKYEFLISIYQIRAFTLLFIRYAEMIWDEVLVGCNDLQTLDQLKNLDPEDISWRPDEKGRHVWSVSPSYFTPSADLWSIPRCTEGVPQSSLQKDCA